MLQTCSGAHNGAWWGEDYAFCRRWREKGGQIWCLPDLGIGLAYFIWHKRREMFMRTVKKLDADLLERRPANAPAVSFYRNAGFTTVASVISEYIDVADAFYDKREKGFVNGLLDAIAKVARPAV